MYLPLPPLRLKLFSHIRCVCSHFRFDFFGRSWKMVSEKNNNNSKQYKKLAIHVGEVLGITLLLFLLLLCLLAWPALIVCPVRGLAKYARAVYNFRCQTFFANTSELSCYRCCCSCSFCCICVGVMELMPGQMSWQLAGRKGHHLFWHFPHFCTAEHSDIYGRI